MTAEAAPVTRSWTVGQRTVTISVPRPKPGAQVFMAAEWLPTEPTRLTTEEWAQYRHGRNRALAELANELGVNVAVLEL